MKICILDAKTLGNVDISPIKSLGYTIVYETSYDNIEEKIKDCEIIINNKVILNESVLKNCKKLKMIALTSKGTNVVDLEYAKRNSIAVANVSGYSTNCVVQHTFAMLFYLCERLKYYDEYVKKGDYCKSDIFTHYGPLFMEISSKTWGIIGLGAIGNAVAKAANAFGTDVIYYSTTGKNNNDIYIRTDLDSLLKQSDIISIHCPLNENTYNLISENELNKMKKNCILLNLSRGGVINEKDLAYALDKNLIYAAGLDVLENEPMRKDNPLLKVKNSDKLLITPHIAWASEEARTRLIEETAENIKAFLNNVRRNRVD